MDKNAIKKYAVWARNELIARVAQKAVQYGITEDETVPASADSLRGKLLTPVEKKQRTALISEIQAKGYKQVIEEIAYTWFNRFSALRFMEVNGYLPTHIRVFTDEENNFAPQILAEAIHLELEGLNKDTVFELKQANKTEELFKYLVITQCNALGSILPGMFQRIEDYTELLFPDNLLREGSVIQQMIELIPEEDWTEQVQIIGWLYQFYNIEPKAEVFAKEGKISKDEIPAATQLFTPDWIVRYMVENSLGRIWVEGHPNNELKATWKYYLDEAEQEPTVKLQLDKIRAEYAELKPEDIKVIDPCMGSGHILAYMFDVLVQIYEAYGYTTRDAVKSIVENNLYGLDIDERAAQLASFSVMMKARQYDKRYFSRKDAYGKPDVIQPRVYSILESNGLDTYAVNYFINGDKHLEESFTTLIREMHDAKEYGSILNISPIDFEALYRRIDEIIDDITLHQRYILDEILPLIKVAEVLSQKYQVVVTNPPYMSISAAGPKLSKYVLKNYLDSKTDLFAVFIERCKKMLVKNGFQAMITMHSWMFLSSFEKLRQKVLNQDTINMAHLGAHAFEEIGGEVVQTTTFVCRNSHISEFKGTYCRLVDPNSQSGKESMFLEGKNRYHVSIKDFTKIPGSPLAYCFNSNLFDIYAENPMLSQVGTTRLGMTTANNELFVRFWYEVGNHVLSLTSPNSDDVLSKGAKWVPYNKGGHCRKWYGNLDCVVFWENDGYQIKHYGEAEGHIRSTVPNTEYYFRECGTWSKISSGNFAMRYRPTGSIFDVAGACLFASTHSDLLSLIGFMNSVVPKHILTVLSPTVNFEGGQIATLPTIELRGDLKTRVNELVENSVDLSKCDWDSFETSWDFIRHPLVPSAYQRREQECSQFARTRMEKFGLISWHYDNWVEECTNRFINLKANEEELNEIFANLYGLCDELNTEVNDRDITVRKADLGREIRSLISYAVGCMFGRYSLDNDGVIYAGSHFDESLYTTYKVDKDNVLPICDDDYFEDDIVGKFVRFIETVYGSATLEENLKFIADALGGKGSPRDVIRNYFINDFYADHLKIYQKRPIYWQFDSGKKNGFKCLIYMHRYQPDTIARIRTDYVHEQQARYRTAIADVEQRTQIASSSERVRLNKMLQKLKDQEAEIHVFEEKIHHLADQMIRIDLNDGVKKNYEIFKDVLTKLK